MATTVCTIKHITVTTVANGAKYRGRVDKDGMEIDEVQLEADTYGDRRVYNCSNCGKNFDGMESFDECKQHLGTFPIDELNALSHTY